MILDPTFVLPYLVVAAALAFAPGPDTVFVIANALRHRAQGAVAAALGVGAGSVVHALAAALGVSALIAASPIAFQALKICGAIYLFYLGLQALWSFFRPATASDEVEAELRRSDVFKRGMITNVLNPKVIVFYLALLPQFVNVDLGNVGLQIFLLGCIHNLMSQTFLISVGLGAGRASDWLKHKQFGRYLDAIAGVFFIGLAVRLAISGRADP